MASNKRLLKVFLCHAEADAKSVRVYYERLTDDGLYVWMDKARIIPGQDKEREARKALEQSDIVVICHSKQFYQQGFHQRVAKIALDRAKDRPEGEIFIIPVRLEQCDVLDDLQRLQPVDLFENPPVATTEDGYQYLLHGLRIYADNVGAFLRRKRTRLPKSPPRLNNEELIPNDVLMNWLSRHELMANPFGQLVPKHYTFYPEGVIRPNQWEYVLLDPIALFAHCPTLEDAQALAYLLRKECLPLDNSSPTMGTNRQIFPVWVWFQQTTPTRPLATLAHSAARTWLDILPKQPKIFIELPLILQNALLELLCWSVGSKEALINLVQIHDRAFQNETISILVRRIYELEPETLPTSLPGKDILLSWLRVRPIGMNQTCVILPGDDLLRIMSGNQLDQFGTLVSDLLPDQIIIKMFAASPRSTSLPFQEMKLSWSDEWLNRSLESQFDAAIHPEEKSGKSIRFHELFGPGADPQDTTERLIAASHSSLARMLVLGNRLFQNHCWKNFSETYLSLEELDDILKQT